MKKFFILSIISFCFFSVVQSQTTIKLTDEHLFFSSYPDISIEESFDTTINCKNGVEVNKKQFQINAPIDFYQTIGTIENNHYSIYELESNLKIDEPKASTQRDLDTLFFVLDQVYDNGIDRVLIDQETNTNGVAVPIWISGTLGYRVLEHGTLNIVSIMRLDLFEVNIVFIDDYEFNGQDTIYISSSDAIHQLIWAPRDINGDSLLAQGQALYNNFTIFFELENGGYASVHYSWFQFVDYRISDYRGSVTMIFGNELINHESGLSNYLIEYPVQDSILEDITFSNDPDQLANIISDVTYYPKRDSNRVGIGRFTKSVSYSGNYGYFGIIDCQDQPEYPSWNTSLYMDMKEIEGFGYGTLYKHYLYKSSEIVDYITTPFYDEFDGMIAGCVFLTPYEDTHLMNYGDSLFYGKGFSYYWSDWQNSSSTIFCETDNIGMWGEYFEEDINNNTYKISDINGNIIQEGDGLEILSYGLEPETYLIEQNRSFCHFNEYIGSSRLTSTINISLDDRTPPHVINVYLLNDNNTIKYQYNNDEQVFIKFTASDFTFYNNFYGGTGFQPIDGTLTKVSIKPHYESEWVDVDYSEIIDDTIIGTQYYAELTNYMLTDSAIYDIKIYIEDLSGNSTEHVFSPAFIYGDFMVNIPDNPNIDNNATEITIYPNPTHDYIIISDKFKIADNYKILNMSGKVLKKDKINQNTNSSKVNINDLSSGIYLITIYNKRLPILTEKIIKLF